MMYSSTILHSRNILSHKTIIWTWMLSKMSYRMPMLVSSFVMLAAAALAIYYSLYLGINYMIMQCVYLCECVL